MIDEQPRRKPRVPLSPEELFYVKQIKKLKELQKIQTFRATSFYKILNRANIVLAAFLSYCVLSILICNKWQLTKVLKTDNVSSEFNREIQKRSISEINIYTNSGEIIPIKTSDLYEEPQKDELLYVGRDLIFNKILKVKLGYDERAFWHLYTYPLFTVCVFALCLGFFVYNVNKHLSVNGLVTVFGLFVLASLYFVLI